MKKIINLFVFIFFVSCASQNKTAPENLKGNYIYVDSKQLIKIEILDNNAITIEEKVEGNRVKCIGNYKIISKKNIKFNCMDERNMHEANSITDFIPLRFDIKNERVYLESNIIKYKNLILKKE
jgi:hypothetical protein